VGGLNLGVKIHPLGDHYVSIWSYCRYSFM